MHWGVVVARLAAVLVVGAGATQPTPAPTPTHGTPSVAPPTPAAAYDSLYISTRSPARLIAAPIATTVGVPITFTLMLPLSRTGGTPPPIPGLAIDFQDGTTPQSIGTLPVSHAFGAPGSYVVRILLSGRPTSVQTTVRIVPGAAHALNASLSWPNGALALELVAGVAIPRPVAYVQVDGAGPITVQWLLDGTPLTTSVLPARGAGTSRIDLTAALPRSGSHAITLKVLAPLQAATPGFPVAPTIRYSIAALAQPGITFPSEPDPVIPASMPQYEFVSSTAPEGFVSDILATAWPQSTGLAPVRNTSLLAAYQHGRTVAYVDRATGDAEVFSDLANASAAGLNREAALTVALRIFANSKIIPQDGTTHDTSETTLESTSGQLAGVKKKSSDVLTFVSLQRRVGRGHFPVFGVGSRALVVIDGAGRVKGFLRRWRTVKAARTVPSTLATSAIRPAIVVQLSPFLPTSPQIKVDRIGIGYYDGDRAALVPVIYYFATLRSTDPAQSRTASDHFVGYVPIAALAEKIPPAAAQRLSRRNVATVEPASAGDPTVAMYVMRGAEHAWRESADQLWSGITSTSTAGQFTRREEIDASPSLYLSGMNQHVNGANIADSEGHGDWWSFWTLGTRSEKVDIRQIPEAGYGGASGGRLAFWIIHSCEVVPSHWDLEQFEGDGGHAFLPWWRVFGGLREVLGYRTEMVIDDDVERAFGEDMGRGGIALSSWFNQIAAAPVYQSRPKCTSQRLGEVTCGRGSVIVVDGHQDDAMLADYTPLASRAKKLLNYWMSDH